MHANAYCTLLAAVIGIGVECTVVINEIAENTGTRVESSGWLQTMDNVQANVLAEMAHIPDCKDWVELYNNADVTRDLDGWTLSHNRGTTQPFVTTFGLNGPIPDSIAPRGYLVICDQMDLSSTSLRDSVELKDAEGAPISSTGHVGLLRAGVTWALGSEGAWGATSTPTPGARNVITSNSHVIINEVAVGGSSDGQCEGRDWIEIFNPGTAAVYLSGFSIRACPSTSSQGHCVDDHTGPFTAVTNQQRTLDLTALTFIEAGGYLVICSSGDEGRSNQGASSGPTFGWALAGDDTVLLLSSVIPLPGHPIHIAVSSTGRMGGKSSVDKTWALDGNGLFEYTTSPTPLAANRITNPSSFAVFINEVSDLGVGAADAAGICGNSIDNSHGLHLHHNEWIELYNHADNAVSLAGWSLHDGMGGLIDAHSWKLPNDAEVPAKGYLVLCGGGRDFSFRIDAGDAITLLDDRGFLVAFTEMDLGAVPHEERTWALAALGPDGVAVYGMAPSYTFTYTATPGAVNKIEHKVPMDALMREVSHAAHAVFHHPHNQQASSWTSLSWVLIVAVAVVACLVVLAGVVWKPATEDDGGYAENVAGVVGFNSAKRMALVSALFFIVSGVLMVVLHATQHDHTVRQDFSPHSFNGAQLAALWKDRRSEHAGLVTVTMMQTASWFALVPPVMCLGHVLGEGQANSRVFTSAFQLGAAIVLINFMSASGTSAMCDSLSTWHVFNFTAGDDPSSHFGALQSLEISYLVSRGKESWMTACDDLLISCGLAALFPLVWRHTQINRVWSLLGLGIAVVSGVMFFVQISQAEHLKVVPTAVAVTEGVLHLGLLPIWIGWLGLQLGRFNGIPTYTNMIPKGSGSQMGLQGASQQPQDTTSSTGTRGPSEIELSSVAHL